MLLPALRRLAILAGLAASVLAWADLTRMSQDLPQVLRLESLDLSPDAHTPLIVGRDALVQGRKGAAADQHIALIRRDKALLAFDIAPDRRVGYVDAKGLYDETSRLALPEGASTLEIGGSVWNVSRKGNRVNLSQGDATVDLSPRGASYRTEQQSVDRIVSLWDRGQALLRGPSLAVSLGGLVDPADLGRAVTGGTLPDPRLPFGAATLRLTATGWTVARGQLPVAVVSGDDRRDVEAHPVTLFAADGTQLVKTLILGRSRYALTPLPQGGLRLTPIQRQVWLTPEEVTQINDPRIRPTVTKPARRLEPTRLIWSGFLALSLVLLVLTLTALPSLAEGRAPAMAAAGLALTLAPDGLIGGGVTAAAASMLALAASTALFGPARRLFGAVLLAAVGTALLLLRSTWPGSVPQSELALAGAWLGLAAPLFAPQMRPSGALFWAVLVALASFGAVSSARLVALEPTEAWAGLQAKHMIAMAATGLTASLGLAAARRDAWPAAHLRRALLPRRPKLAKLALVLMAGSCFAAVTLLGDETGFRGLFQPSEFAKSLLCVLVASTVSLDLARRQMLTAQEGGLSLVPMGVATLVALAIAGASAANYDMSPILVCAIAVLAALAAGAALHVSQTLRGLHQRKRQGLPVPRPAFAWPETPLWRQSKRLRARWSSFWPVLVFVALCVLPVGLGAHLVMSKSFAPNADFDAPSFLLTPWKRAQSHFDMRLGTADPLIDMPETGTQLKLGRLAILDAPCRLHMPTGCPRSRPAPEPEAATEALLRVPAVQDDFASVALTHALGLDGAVIYAAAQAALIALTLAIGLTALLAPLEFRIGSWFLGCATIGLGALVAAQFAVAWANALGALPTMGQPMTFVSLGASHHLGVALPFALVTLLTTHATGPRRSADHEVRNQIFRRSALS